MANKPRDIQPAQLMELIYSMLRLRTEDSGLKISEIHEALIQKGVSVSEKQVRRYIEKMSDSHKIQSIGEKPVYYFASGDFKPDYHLNFREDELQILLLALDSMKQMSSGYMQNLTIQTEATLLSKLPIDVMKDADTLRSFSCTSPTYLGKAAAADRETYNSVLRALREGKRLTCTYKGKTRILSPLQFRFSAGSFYLHAYDHKEKKIKSWNVARMSNVEVLEEKANLEKAKEIKQQNILGGYGGTDEPLYDYRIVCKQELAFFFKEHKLNDSLKIEKEGENFVVTFRANNSLDIIRNLAGNGEFIIDVQPPVVYEKLKNIWKAGLNAG